MALAFVELGTPVRILTPRAQILPVSNLGASQAAYCTGMTYIVAGYSRYEDKSSDGAERFGVRVDLVDPVIVARPWSIDGVSFSGIEITDQFITVDNLSQYFRKIRFLVNQAEGQTRDAMRHSFLQVLARSSYYEQAVAACEAGAQLAYGHIIARDFRGVALEILGEPCVDSGPSLSEMFIQSDLLQQTSARKGFTPDAYCLVKEADGGTHQELRKGAAVAASRWFLWESNRHMPIRRKRAIGRRPRLTGEYFSFEVRG